MEHSYYRDKISAFKDNGLNTEEQHLIGLHLKECDECRELLKKLEALDSLVGRESHLSSDEYFEKLASRIDEKIAGNTSTVTDITPKSRWAGLTWKIGAMAASVAFLVFIGYHSDDILPPSNLESESPVLRAPTSMGMSDSVELKREDLSDDRAASLTSPKPSPAKLKSQSAAGGYFSDQDSDDKEDIQGDLGAFNSNIAKDSPAKEKIFIRGGRANEVEYIVGDIEQEGVENTPKELLTERTSKKVIDKFKTNAAVSVSGQEIKEETIGESDSNYKRARKSAPAIKGTVEDKLSADDVGERSEVRESLIFQDGLNGTFSFSAVSVPDQIMTSWRKTRDSLVATMPKFDRQKIKSISRDYLSKNYDEVSQVDKNLALELELFELLRIVVRASEDSLETKWAVNMTRQLAQFGYAETKVRAKLYLDSLNSARTKNNEERK